MPDENQSRPRPDAINIALGSLAVVMVIAIAAILFIPTSESGTPDPAPQSLPDQSDGEADQPSTTLPRATTSTTGPSLTGVTSSPQEPFELPPAMAGSWIIQSPGQGSAELDERFLRELSATMDSPLGPLSIGLRRPARYALAATPTSPVGIVIEGVVEVNGVEQKFREPGTLQPTPGGLVISIPITLTPAHFDLDGATGRFEASLTLLPQ